MTDAPRRPAPGGLTKDVIKIGPRRDPIDSVVTPPGSKSITNRALLVAALASGRSTITGALQSDDTEAMKLALGKLGASIDRATNGTALHVEGTGGAITPGPLTVSAREAGTVARFLAPVLTLGAGEYVMDADPQMRHRPMGPLLTALRSLGADIEGITDRDSLPLLVRARGNPGGRIDINGSLSSQFLSALLLSAPLMAAGLMVDHAATVSRPYVDLTAEVMEAFGATVLRTGHDSFNVPFTNGYQARTYAVEPDATAASYFLAAAAVTHGRIRVLGLGSRSRQGDVGFAQLLEEMGARVEITTDSITVDCRARQLSGIDVDLRDMSDLVPTLAIVAATASSPSRIRGVGFIRNKESNRILAVAEGLRAFGADVTEEDDGLRISPRSSRPAVVHSHGDHRLAMSFAVLGLAVPGTVIHGSGSVSKTFPDFFEVLQGLGTGPSGPP